MSIQDVAHVRQTWKHDPTCVVQLRSLVRCAVPGAVIRLPAKRNTAHANHLLFSHQKEVLTVVKF